MKLIYAIVRNDNEDDVMDALNSEHFQVTKLASTGGFLRKGNLHGEHLSLRLSVSDLICYRG